MRDSFSVANKFYKEFESYYPYVTLKDWLLLLFLISGCFFIAIIVYLVVSFDGSISGAGFIYLLSSEAVFITSSLFLRELRDKRLVNIFNAKYGWRCERLDEVKKRRLQALLDAGPEFFSLKAKQFDEAFDLYHKYRPAFDFSVKSFANWIYAPDARPRILTLLLFLGSAILLLTARENISLSAFFDFYYTATWAQILLAYFVIFFVLALGLISLSIIFKGAIQLLYLWSWRTGGPAYINENISGYIIRALFEFHETKSDKRAVLEKLRRQKK